MKIKAGSIVRVNPCGTKLDLRGILLADYDSADSEMPRIKLPHGKIIMGYECWWTPVKRLNEESYKGRDR